MSNSFTPGKWTATEAGVITDAPTRANVICEAPIHYLDSANNWRANAPLIAAAPDLLAACESIFLLADPALYNAPSGIRANYVEFYRRVVAAIARANGSTTEEVEAGWRRQRAANEAANG